MFTLLHRSDDRERAGKKQKNAQPPRNRDGLSCREAAEVFEHCRIIESCSSSSSSSLLENKGKIEDEDVDDCEKEHEWHN